MPLLFALLRSQARRERGKTGMPIGQALFRQRLDLDIAERGQDERIGPSAGVDRGLAVCFQEGEVAFDRVRHGERAGLAGCGMASTHHALAGPILRLRIAQDRHAVRVRIVISRADRLDLVSLRAEIASLVSRVVWRIVRAICLRPGRCPTGVQYMWRDTREHASINMDACSDTSVA